MPQFNLSKFPVKYCKDEDKRLSSEEREFLESLNGMYKSQFFSRYINPEEVYELINSVGLLIAELRDASSSKADKKLQAMPFQDLLKCAYFIVSDSGMLAGASEFEQSRNLIVDKMAPYLIAMIVPTIVARQNEFKGNQLESLGNFLSYMALQLRNKGLASGDRAVCNVLGAMITHLDAAKSPVLRAAGTELYERAVFAKSRELAVKIGGK